MKIKRGKITRIILSVVKVSSIITVAMVAPNAVLMFKLFDKNDSKRRYYVKNKTLDLVSRGYLKFVSKNGKKVLRLTEKGEIELLKYNKQKDFQKKWDGKWRVIVYDVWENNRSKRDSFRESLKNYGFKMLQNSVWIYPYDCEAFVGLLKAEKKFGNNVKYLLVEKVENDKSVRKKFNLP